MWHLKKPSLKSAIEDLENIISICKDINQDNKCIFEDLYKEYDSHNGSISDYYHNVFMKKYPIHAVAMKNQYKNTYDGEKLFYIREELTRDVYKCPYCGFGEPTTLDHYQPESIYGELATCRLNLVPICWKCNKEKNDKNYQMFIHSYYQKFNKEVIFFKCKVEAKKEGVMVFDYYIDGSNIDGELKKVLESQILSIKLNERLCKQSVSYICDNFDIGFNNNADLKFFISDKLLKVRRKKGNNDWQAALLDGLFNCEELDILCIRNFISRNSDVTGI